MKGLIFFCPVCALGAFGHIKLVSDIKIHSFRHSLKAAYFKRPLWTIKLFFRRDLKAPREASRPPGALTSPPSVSAHGRRGSRSSAKAPLPPPSSSSYLPASLGDRQPTARRPAAARSPVSLRPDPRRCFCRLRAPPQSRLASSVASLLGGGNSVFASFVLQLPFKTYGENGQTSSYKPNFPAADSRRAEIPAGKSSEAAFPSRWRYGLKTAQTGLARTPESAFASSRRCLLLSLCWHPWL